MSTPPAMQLNTPVVKNWCHTEKKLIKFSLTWTINNFSFCAEQNGTALISLPFSAGHYDQSKWNLNVYPKGLNEASKNYVSIYLNSIDLDITALCKISILNSKKEEKYVRKTFSHYFFKATSHGYPQFIEREYLLNKDNDLLPDGKLTLFCEVTIVSGDVSTSGQSNIVKFKVPKSKLATDFGNILDNSKFSDVTITIDDRKVRAHKIILTARSTVFAAMFDHQMEEATSNCVHITDIDYEVFMEMLRFMYTGEAPNLDEMADGLLVAADKYDLEVLKVLCEEALCSHLTVETAAKTLILADLNSALHLKEETIDYICFNAAAVAKTQGWKDMIKTHSHLIAEAFEAIAKQKVST